MSPQEKLDEANDLATQLDGVEKLIKRQQEIQGTLQQSMRNAETALTKIADLQRLSIEGGGKPSESTGRQWRMHVAAFTQRRTNTSRPTTGRQWRMRIAAFTLRRTNTSRPTRQSPRSTTYGINSNNRSPGIDAELRQFKNKSQAEYNDARRSHDLKIASLKLAFVVPLLLLALRGW